MTTKTNLRDGIRKPQRYLGEKGLIVLIAFLSAFIPLSTDLYLPALPRMAENFKAAPSLINLTLILFFLFYAAGTLVWGPLSDKYGRKRILVIGLVLYTVASAPVCLFG
ncbi:Membrane transport protein [Desulfosporosinus metallidurans]|uniref:Membrane transport protein n=1 Tax=Desulfosporosinus metallidurans TaxID=1888891 RepID=A0A1Q8QR58_9FIRM|nr:Membrane transport protein [Desulfosporosinus metallidurans]